MTSQLDENPLKRGFVKGHDFSHANKVNRISRALAPGLFRLLQLNFVSNLRDLQTPHLDETPSKAAL